MTQIASLLHERALISARSARNSVFAALVAITAVLEPWPVEAQLQFRIGRSADNTKVYVGLRHDASDDAGVDIDRVFINSFIASTTNIADACTASGSIFNMLPAEAWSSTSSGFAALAIAQVEKSAIIGDATVPRFNPSANGGKGSMCVGPGCVEGVCAVSATCVVFTAGSGSAASASTDTPAAALVEPLTIGPPDADICAQSSRASYVFGGVGAPTVLQDLCSAAPVTGGFTLDSTASTLAGGTNGQSIIYVFDVGSTQFLSTAFSGFGAGQNASICGADGVRVLNAIGITLNLPAPNPIPTVTPTQTPTSTPTLTPTSTPTVSPTTTSTQTPTVSPSSTPTDTATPTPTVTATASVGGCAGLDVDGSSQTQASTDGVYIFRRMLGLITIVPPSFRTLDPSIPDDATIGANIDALGSGLDVDDNGSVQASTDGVYIFRDLLGLLTIVPTSFRALDPAIPDDATIAANIAGLCGS